MAGPNKLGVAPDLQAELLSMSLTDILEQLSEFGSLPGSLPVLEHVSDERAAAMLRRRALLERELIQARNWFERRRASIRRGQAWIDENLKVWAMDTHKRTGLKTFPCGEGTARIRKASAKIEWLDYEARPWLLELAKQAPEVVKEFDHAEVLKHVEWTEPNADGIREAVAAVDIAVRDDAQHVSGYAKGTVLDGLVKNERPGALSVSVKISATDAGKLEDDE